MTGTGAPGAKRAAEWLASVAPDPDACRWEWERSPHRVALLPAGRRWDVLILPGELGGPTLDVLTRLVGRPGPVLADFGDARIGFFVPPGTATGWLGTGVRGAGTGTWIAIPHPGRVGGGVRWLVPPDGTGLLTDAVLLERAMHEAAGRIGRGGGEG
ncbi:MULTISPECIES: hypothetical protein [unclassified Streptomyces]|uniref:hypothetical protein n=1 Tax=unclassified Streptomyces TaxID=2593676 RepID=UPI0016613A92|nr:MULTISPECIES: hypothetical protein [unclassified Streptomyces]MBD0711358.1 hypothetical protein [Streptomyces sp. CBMA291]MBD0718095.1 hypothetical protein [Streptomyces sp. CBMA370]